MTNHQLGARNAASDRILRTGRGQLCRCCLCKGLHFQFGNLSAQLDAESFLRLANMVHRAATVIGPKLVRDQRVVIPFGPGQFSLLLDRDELAELHGMVQHGLRWLDGWEALPALTMH
jgi:hypothetical protein